MFSLAARPRRMPVALPVVLGLVVSLVILLLTPSDVLLAQAAAQSQEAPAGDAAPAAQRTAAGTPDEPPTGKVVETVLESRNRVALELGGKPVSLVITIRSFETGRRLRGEISFILRSDEPPPPTDELTCAASLSFGCGVVARFSGPRRKPDAPAVFESEVADGVVWIRSDRSKRGSNLPSDDFEKFVAGIIENPRLGIRLRVDQRQDFNFDLRNLSWPLADFADEHPFSKRFKDDPVLAGLRKRYPARYLKVFDVVRQVAPDTGTLSPEAQTRILDAMHTAIGGLRPMVPDELLEKIVMNAVAASRAVSSEDAALCNALAVAARSAVTTPQLQDTPIAREEYELWAQVVEQANPRYIRKVPNEALQSSSDRFEANVRRANESGCGMFAAVTEAMLELPPAERRLWLRATVGTVEELRNEPRPAPR